MGRHESPWLPAETGGTIMSAPNCPNCGKPITRVVDVPYGWWDWDDAASAFKMKTAANRVDVAPWVHVDCMGELRHFHPQNTNQSTSAVAGVA